MATEDRAPGVFATHVKRSSTRLALSAFQNARKGNGMGKSRPGKGRSALPRRGTRDLQRRVREAQAEVDREAQQVDAAERQVAGSSKIMNNHEQ